MSAFDRGRVKTQRKLTVVTWRRSLREQCNERKTFHQALIACSSGCTPMIFINRFML